MILLTAEQKAKIKTHTLACYPEEACGIITGNDFIPLKNNSATPTESFKIVSEDIVKYIGTIKAIVHSHCYTKDRPSIFDIRTPSLRDMEEQKISDIPWLIVGTEGINVLDPLEIPRIPSKNLLGRPFIWFINDCYTLVQDYYKYYLNIELPPAKITSDYRDLRHYNKTFEPYIAEYGFSEIKGIDDMRNGDIILLDNGIASQNHLGVYHEGNIFSQEAVSQSNPFYKYIGRVQKRLRYDNLA